MKSLVSIKDRVKKRYPKSYLFFLNLLRKNDFLFNLLKKILMNKETLKTEKQDWASELSSSKMCSSDNQCLDNLTKRIKKQLLKLN